MRIFSTFAAIFMVFFIQGCEIVVSDSTASSGAAEDSGSGGSSGSGGDSGSSGGDSGSGASSISPPLSSDAHFASFLSFNATISDSLGSLNVDNSSSVTLLDSGDSKRLKTADFDGTQQLIVERTGSYEFYTYDRNFIVSAWFKTSAAASQAILDSLGTNGDRFFMELKADGTVGGYFTTQASTGNCWVVLESAAGLNDNQWHHVALIRNGARTGELYVDNTLVASDVNNGGCGSVGVDTVGDLFIGSRADSTRYFTGQIDDVYFSQLPSGSPIVPDSTDVDELFGQ